MGLHQGCLPCLDTNTNSYINPPVAATNNITAPNANVPFNIGFFNLPANAAIPPYTTSTADIAPSPINMFSIPPSFLANYQPMLIPTLIKHHQQQKIIMFYY